MAPITRTTTSPPHRRSVFRSGMTAALETERSLHTTGAFEQDAHEDDMDRTGRPRSIHELLGEILPHGRATITVPEAGEILGIGEAASYRAARRGDIPVLKFGRRVVVPVPALRRLIEFGNVAPGEATMGSLSQDDPPSRPVPIRPRRSR